MTTIRKLIALALCLCMLFVFASCETLEGILEKINPKDPTDDTTPDTPPTVDEIIDSITKEEWNAAIKDEKFDNVTFSISVIQPDETEPYLIVCKIAGNKGAYAEGSWGEIEADAEILAAMKSIYMNTIRMSANVIW